ncbi:uncharacterized protein LOC135477974 [Liolophura sinensis]|uniref:uncharacterized protein LOC135477974 n=1 Tax=Liolophura sinensis TaxID=3198878 RepID=UPI0031596513
MGKRKFKKTVAGTAVARKKTEVNSKENATKKTAAKYKIDQLLDKAQDCIDRFEYEVAQKFCQRALELEPDNVRVLETTGTLLLELGNPESARQCFGRAVEVSPDTGYSKYMYLGQLFEGAQAVQCFQKGIELMVAEKEAKEALEVAAACASGDGRTISERDISSAYCSIAEIYMTDSCFEENAEELCKTAVEKAIEADGENPEAYQLMASLQLSQQQTQLAKENINKSVSLWLPKYRCSQNAEEPSEQIDPLQMCPLTFETRMAASKILIEVEEFETASEILEGLLDENDEETEVWYLLGWLNYLQGEEYRGNARYYLRKAAQVYKKTKCEDKPLLKHTEELLVELGPGEEEENEDDGDCVDNSVEDNMEDEENWETDSEDEERMDH